MSDNPVRVADPSIVASEVQADGIGRTGSDDSPDRDQVKTALVDATKRLTIAARTSGGVAGRDDDLCYACDAAESVLSEVK